MSSSGTSDKTVQDLLIKHRAPLMGIAALWILLFHTWIPLAGDITGLDYVEQYLKQIGCAGVDVFFLLSGLGLVRSYNTNGTLKFYYRRFKRLAIPFYISVALFLLWDGTFDILTYVKNISGYSTLFENFFAVTWFVPAIGLMYLLFPVYYRMMRAMRSPYLFTAFAIVICILSITVCEVWGGQFNARILIYRIPAFLIGVLIGQTAHMKSRPWKVTPFITSVSVIIFAASSFVLFATLAGTGILPNAGQNPSLFLSSALLTGLSSVIPVTLLLDRSDSHRVLTFLGTISVELYCLQEGLFLRYVKFIGSVCPEYFPLPPLIVIYLVFVILIVVSSRILNLINTYFWKLIEKVINH